MEREMRVRPGTPDDDNREYLPIICEFGHWVTRVREMDGQKFRYCSK